MVYGIIYQALNKINNKKYIGLTTIRLSSRKAAHNGLAKKGANNHFHKAIRKWGFENFEWSILFEGKIEIKELYNLEIKFISEIKPEYNKTNGGEGSHGFKMPKEIVEKLRLNKIGKKLPKEHVLKIALANKGKKHSEENLERFRNRYFSPEHRRKIGLKHKGKVLSEETRLKITKS